uniref:PlsC domain-containing protein n=1 Tax=Macrostomum lignano TaxID=282301 RepID=A0A1I8JRE1_9PLAT
MERALGRAGAGWTPWRRGREQPARLEHAGRLTDTAAGLCASASPPAWPSQRATADGGCEGVDARAEEQLYQQQQQQQQQQSMITSPSTPSSSSHLLFLSASGGAAISSFATAGTPTGAAGRFGFDSGLAGDCLGESLFSELAGFGASAARMDGLYDEDIEEDEADAPVAASAAARQRLLAKRRLGRRSSLKRTASGGGGTDRNRLIENLQTELQLKNQQLEEQSCELRQTKSELSFQQRQTEALLANESAMNEIKRTLLRSKSQLLRICLESQLSRMKAEVERLNSELNIGGCSRASAMFNGSFSDTWQANEKTGRPRKGVFEDLVDERRQRGDLGWDSAVGAEPGILRRRDVGSVAAIKSSKSPADINRDVLSSDRLTYGLREISLETGRPMPELMSEAGAILDEMSHCLSMFAIRSFGYAVAKVMKRIYRGVFVNTEGITQYPVVLMPMHRSYADFLLLSLVCYDYDLPLPAIASAM